MALSINGTRLQFGPRSVDERMSHWFGLPANAARDVLIGIDSVTEWNNFIGVNGVGELLRNTMNAEWGSRGHGFLGVHRNQAIPNANEWVTGASWVGFTKQDLNDDGLWPGTEGLQHPGSTSTAATNLLTLNEIPETTTRFEHVWQDMSGVAGAWAYRIDGGSWVDNPATRTNNNAMKRELIASSISTSLDIRPCNAAGTTATLAGYDGVILLNNNTEGTLYHLVSKSGALAQQMARSSRGSPLSLFSLVDTLDLAIIESGNDATTTKTVGDEGNPYLFGLNLMRICAAVPSTASIVLMTIPPLDDATFPDRPISLQEDWVDETFKVARAVGAPVVDIFTAWGGSYTAAVNLGFTSVGDGLHATQAGHDDMHTRLCATLGIT